MGKTRFVRIKPKDIKGNFKLNYKVALFWARLGEWIRRRTNG